MKHFEKSIIQVLDHEKEHFSDFPYACSINHFKGFSAVPGPVQCLNLLHTYNHSVLKLNTTVHCRYGIPVANKNSIYLSIYLSTHELVSNSNMKYVTVNV